MDLNHCLSVNIETKTDSSGKGILKPTVGKNEFDSNALLKENNTVPYSEIENIENEPVKNVITSKTLECQVNLKSNIEINSEYGQDEPITVKLENIGSEICNDTLEVANAELNDCRIASRPTSIEKSKFNSQDQLNTLERGMYKEEASGNTQELEISGIADCKKQASLDLVLNVDGASKLVIGNLNSKKYFDKIKGCCGKNLISKSDTANTCKALVRYHPYFMPFTNVGNHQQYKRKLIPSSNYLLHLKEKPQELKVLIPLPDVLPIERPNVMNSLLKNLLAPECCPISLVNNGENGLIHADTLIPTSAEKLDSIKNCDDPSGKQMKFDAQSSGMKPKNTYSGYKSSTVDTCVVNNCNGIVPYCSYARYLWSINYKKYLNTKMNVIPLPYYNLTPASGKPQELEGSITLQGDLTHTQEIDGQPSDLKLNNKSLEDEKCLTLYKSSYQSSQKESFIDSDNSVSNLNIPQPSKVYTLSQSVQVDNEFVNEFSPLSSPEDELLKKRIKLAIETLDRDIDRENKESSKALNIERDVIDSDLDDIIERSIEKFESFTAEKGVLATPTTSEQSCQTCDKMPDQLTVCKRSLFLNDDPKKLKYNNHMSNNENPPPAEVPQFEESVSQFYITPPQKVQFLVGEEESEDDGDSEKTMFSDQDTEYSSALWNWSPKSDSAKKSTKDQHVPYSPGTFSFISTPESSIHSDESNETSITDYFGESSISEYSEDEYSEDESSEDDSELAKPLKDD